MDNIHEEGSTLYDTFIKEGLDIFKDHKDNRRELWDTSQKQHDDDEDELENEPMPMHDESIDFEKLSEYISIEQKIQFNPSYK